MQCAFSNVGSQGDPRVHTHRLLHAGNIGLVWKPWSSGFLPHNYDNDDDDHYDNDDNDDE